MVKYPSIEQFRNIVRAVRTKHDYQGKDADGSPIYRNTSPYPTLSFTGRVKLHGTNAAVVKYKDRIEFQSRERVLSVGSDNAGFATAMSGKELGWLFSGMQFNEYIAIFGEWCGGNIQKGVALNELPKVFVIFGAMIDGVWIDYFNSNDREQGIYHIDNFPTWKVDIDFNSPEAIQNKLIELTIAVEDECPFAKAFGVSGIGEGIVFTCDSDPNLKFKSKGEKHSSSKVTKIASVDTEELENIQQFIEYAATENRLKQGLEVLSSNGIELSPKNTGEFIQWVMKDILKEEEDVVVSSKLEWKKITGKLAPYVRQWYFKNLS